MQNASGCPLPGVHIRPTVSPLRSWRSLSFTCPASACAQQWQLTMSAQKILFKLPPIEENVCLLSTGRGRLLKHLAQRPSGSSADANEEIQMAALFYGKRQVARRSVAISDILMRRWRLNFRKCA